MQCQPFQPRVSEVDFSLDLDRSIVANRGVSQNSKTERQTVYILMRRLVRATIFGSTLFAKVRFGLQD